MCQKCRNIFVLIRSVINFGTTTPTKILDYPCYMLYMTDWLSFECIVNSKGIGLVNVSVTIRPRFMTYILCLIDFG